MFTAPPRSFGGMLNCDFTSAHSPPPTPQPLYASQRGLRQEGHHSPPVATVSWVGPIHLRPTAILLGPNQVDDWIIPPASHRLKWPLRRISTYHFADLWLCRLAGGGLFDLVLLKRRKHPIVSIIEQLSFIRATAKAQRF
jgi:hypothetical protein